MGIGDWGLGIGDWGLGPIPNPQSPNPQSPIHIFQNTLKSINKLINLYKYYLNLYKRKYYIKNKNGK